MLSDAFASVIRMFGSIRFHIRFHLRDEISRILQTVPQQMQTQSTFQILLEHRFPLSTRRIVGSASMVQTPFAGVLESEPLVVVVLWHYFVTLQLEVSSFADLAQLFLSVS